METDSPLAGATPPLPATLEPGGLVTVWHEQEWFDLQDAMPPCPQVGFRDARGRVHYCVGGIRGWWIRRRIVRKDTQAADREMQQRIRERQGR